MVDSREEKVQFEPRELNNIGDPIEFEDSNDQNSEKVKKSPKEQNHGIDRLKVEDVTWIKPFLDDPVTNPHKFDYVLNPEGACEKETFLLVYVHSHPVNAHRRGVIRKTWGNPNNFPDLTIKVIFVLGISVDKGDLDDTIQLEAMEFNDIVQENFIDAYENMTLKAIAGLKWISNHCSNAKFVLKTDDDALINTYTLLQHLQDLDNSNVYNQKLLLCRVWWKMDVSRDGKWAVPEEVIPDKFYPPYCSGIMYIMSIDVAVVLYRMSLSVKPFWVDDVYITGLLPQQIGLELSDFIWAYAPVGELDKYYVESEWFKYAFTHINNMTLIINTWNRIKKYAHEYEIPQIDTSDIAPGKLALDYKMQYNKAKEEKGDTKEEKKEEKEKSRRDVENPHNYNRMLEPNSGCDDDTFLVNFIYSEPEQAGRRRLARNTWSKSSLIPGFKMKTIFVSGYKNDIDAKQILELEAEDYGDILLEDFDDDYAHKYLKSVGALKWISQKCKNVKFVLKADDDTIVNMYTLSKHLQNLHSVDIYRTGVILCNRLWTIMPVAREGMYAISVDSFPDELFPPYCSGLGWVMSSDVAFNVLEKYYNLKPPFIVDDALITGYYVRDMKGVKHYDLRDTFVEMDDMAAKLNGDEWYKYIFSHAYKLVEAKSVWTKLVQLKDSNPAPNVQIIDPAKVS